MPLAPGHKLGPYEVLFLLGKGGMGEVYKAHDTRLNRDVAIKVSTKQFSERFEREAKAIAALNHPNICTLYDVGPNYLVMEFVDGAPLKGPYPLETAIAYARQITSALEAAHDKAITHRDLKPGNIMLKPDGTIKVLDFGLAKFGGPQPTSISEDSPTLSMAATVAGTILGTAAYMAPEQARGKEVDKRADIWAFGVVLHEILTGERLFKGEDLTETLAAVVMREPDLAPVPHEVRRLLKKCLQKDPAKRLRDIGDAWDYLDEPPAAPPEPVTIVQKEPASKLPWLAAAALALALIGLGAWAYSRPATEIPSAVARFTFTPPSGYTLTARNNSGPQVAVSPDGRYVAFVADSAAESGSNSGSLWVRAIDSLTAEKLDKTEGAQFPFWSPDSKDIAFFAGGKLKRIPMSGGTPLNICDSAVAGLGTWAQLDGTSGAGVILFSTFDGGIRRVPGSGGVPVMLTKPNDGANAPQFLPGGKRFLYLKRTGDKPGLYVQALDSDQATFLPNIFGRVMLAPPNFLLFVREGTLLAQQWDWETLRPLSEPASVADEVRYNAGGLTAFSISESTLAFRTARSAAVSQYRWFTRDGKPEGEGLEPANYELVRRAPDGKKAVIRKVSGGGADLFLLDFSSGVLSQITSDAESEGDPVWSPDSRRVAYTKRKGDKQGMYQTVVGSGKSVFLYSGVLFAEDWTADGLLVRSGGTLSLLPSPDENATAVSTAKPRLLAELPGNNDQFIVSPDGKWVAYYSRQNDTPEVWVAAYPSFTARRKVADGMAPFWRADGKELVFAVPGRGLMSVDTKLGAEFSSGPAKPLFNPPGAQFEQTSAYFYTITNDAGRFLALVNPAGAATETEAVHVILNWQSLLK